MIQSACVVKLIHLLFTFDQFHSERIANAFEPVAIKHPPQLTLMILLFAARIQYWENDKLNDYPFITLK